MALSIDLRIRVINLVDEGDSITSLAERFCIGRKTIYNWLARREKTGSLQPSTNHQKGHSHTITDWEAFGVFVAQRTHLTAPEMCVEWEKINKKRISKSVMKRGLKTLGYTFKKNNFAIKKQTSRLEPSLYKK